MIYHTQFCLVFEGQQKVVSSVPVKPDSDQPQRAGVMRVDYRLDQTRSDPEQRRSDQTNIK